MAHYYGGFKSESNCSCPNSQLIATKFIVAEYDCDDDHTSAKVTGVVRKFNRAGFFVLTGLGVTPATAAVLDAEEEICGDVVQRSLEVEFKCEQCGQIVHKTYEIRPNGTKWDAFGRYTDIHPVKISRLIYNRTYEDVERIYHGM
ncbi:hypothetical protein niasHT_031665 [Heterodera trifolii]|uniref:Uncharacterized protein n=1 Tax=Heterodera trifolii TaxID=157864 RepID=A0ABD2J4F0_9BILA